MVARRWDFLSYAENTFFAIWLGVWVHCFVGRQNAYLYFYRDIIMAVIDGRNTLGVHFIATVRYALLFIFLLHITSFPK